jgi:hypothetical protein
VEQSAIAFDDAAPSQRARSGHPAPLRAVDTGDHEPGLIRVRREVEELSVLLGAMNVTAAVLMPGVFDLSDPTNFAALDKLTVVVPPEVDYPRTRQFSLGDLEFDFTDVSVSRASNATELTGYPALLEIA